jgi:hypothetical protein
MVQLTTLLFVISLGSAAIFVSWSRNSPEVLVRRGLLAFLSSSDLDGLRGGAISEPQDDFDEGNVQQKNHDAEVVEALRHSH